MYPFASTLKITIQNKPIAKKHMSWNQEASNLSDDSVHDNNSLQWGAKLRLSRHNYDDPVQWLCNRHHLSLVATHLTSLWCVLDSLLDHINKPQASATVPWITVTWMYNQQLAPCSECKRLSIDSSLATWPEPCGGVCCYVMLFFDIAGKLLLWW